MFGRKEPPLGSVVPREWNPLHQPAGSGPDPVGRCTAAPAPGPRAADAAHRADEGAGSRLIVGPNIKLKGVEIDDCDTLVVEGRVEATMVSRAIQIAEHGSFKGTADIEVAEIRGTYEGELTVRGRLVLHATGRISGKVRYGKLLVQEGGEISGDIGTVADRVVAARPA